MSNKNPTESEKLMALTLGFFSVFTVMGIGVFGKQLVQLRKDVVYIRNHRQSK